MRQRSAGRRVRKLDDHRCSTLALPHDVQVRVLLERVLDQAAVHLVQLLLCLGTRRPAAPHWRRQSRELFDGRTAGPLSMKALGGRIGHGLHVPATPQPPESISTSSGSLAPLSVGAAIPCDGAEGIAWTLYVGVHATGWQAQPQSRGRWPWQSPVA